MMRPPNLSDTRERAEYKRELRSIQRGNRLAGFILVLAGATLIFWARAGGPWFLGDFQTTHIGWLLIALGFAVFIYVIVKRSRYHQARMRGNQGTKTGG